MKRAFMLSSLMVLVALAGCVQDDSGSDGGEDPADTSGFPNERLTIPEDPMHDDGVDGHSHLEVDQHQYLWNYEFSDKDPLQGNEVAFASGLHALDLQNGFLFGAIYGSETASANGGMQIWDLSDPAHPQARGAVVIPGTVGGDRSIGATEDGDYVVIGAEQVDCFGHTNPIPVAAYLIDATDKDNPQVVDTLTSTGSTTGSPTDDSLPVSVHSVYVKTIGDKDYAFLSGIIYEIVREGPTGAQLVSTGSSIRTGHDLYLRDTPWGDVWGLAAGGGGDFTVYNVNDPTDPILIAQWNLQDRGTDNYTGPDYYFHTADVAFFDDGQILMMMSSEDWGDHVSPFWIFDATELRDLVPGDDVLVLEEIGMWANPGGHNAGEYIIDPNATNPDDPGADPQDLQKGGLSFSLHNPRWLDNGLLTMSHYHGGLWVLDFRHPDFRAEPNVIGYAVYSEGNPPAAEDPAANAVESAACQLGIRIETPTYMDQEVDQETGIMYAADVYMGLYTFVPTTDHPVYGGNATSA